MELLQYVAVAFGIAAVLLSARENPWNWPLGIINVGLYILIFYDAKFYAGMALQVVYVVLAVYGWWHWLHGGANHGALRVSRVPLREGVLLALGFLVGTGALWTLLSRQTDASLPLADSALTAASLVAQYMMTRKYVESWLVWIVADVGYVAMFLYRSLSDKDLWPTAGLYLVFCILAVFGWRLWRASLRASPAPEAAFA
jgi:nicotinamide mononucleotide transporter